MIVDRKGRRVSELAGPGAPAQLKPPPPALAAKLAATTYSAWLWRDWVWDSRAMRWRAEWHHRSLPVTVRDYGEYVAGALNYRHWRTAATPAAVLELLVPIGDDVKGCDLARAIRNAARPKRDSARIPPR